jgi:alkyl hydroperoxide reductase subunit AhpC
MSMSRLVLEFSDEQDLNLLITLAKKLNAKVIEVSKDEVNSSVYWLEQIAKNGGIQAINNPSEWQRNLRNDNKLPNREL